MSYRFTTCLFAALVVAGTIYGAQARAADPALRCEAGKLKQSAKYEACLLTATAKGLLKGLPANSNKCESKFLGKFAGSESKAGPGVCPSEDDVTYMGARIAADAADVATLLAGGSIAPYTGYPASGQATDFGPESDGAAPAGAALVYVDNGDGTVTDLDTGLMWEKKDASGGVHDMNNVYTWSATGTNLMDGTIVTTFLATLNDVAGVEMNCFAGYCDWRVPNAKELQGIVDYEVAMPAIDPAFHRAATCAGCTDVILASCSCSGASEYWTSTTLATSPITAWVVFFGFGGVVNEGKGNEGQVRAVRGGL